MVTGAPQIPSPLDVRAVPSEPRDLGRYQVHTGLACQKVVLYKPGWLWG